MEYTGPPAFSLGGHNDRARLHPQRRGTLARLFDELNIANWLARQQRAIATRRTDAIAFQDWSPTHFQECRLTSVRIPAKLASSSEQGKNLSDTMGLDVS